MRREVDWRERQRTVEVWQRRKENKPSLGTIIEIVELETHKKGGAKGVWGVGGMRRRTQQTATCAHAKVCNKLRGEAAAVSHTNCHVHLYNTHHILSTDEA